MMEMAFSNSVGDIGAICFRGPMGRAMSAARPYRNAKNGSTMVVFLQINDADEAPICAKHVRPRRSP